jgi:hypothetical protein
MLTTGAALPDESLEKNGRWFQGQRLVTIVTSRAHPDQYFW